MLSWVILVPTLFFLLYVTTMSFKVSNSLTIVNFGDISPDSILEKPLRDYFVKISVGETFSFLVW